MDEHLENLWESTRRHALGVHASALAFHLLSSLVPLVLLGVALLDVLGLEEIWATQVGPPLREKLALPVYLGVDHMVQEIFRAPPWPVVLLASLMLVWFFARVVYVTAKALNDIHEVDENRPLARRLATYVGLAASSGLCVVGAFVALTVLPRLAGGLAHAALLAAALAISAVLLGVAVRLLLRYAPANGDASWATAGSAFIVVGWLVQSLAFGWWTSSVASYESAVGQLAAFLVLATYVALAAAIFLVGAEVDAYASANARGSRSARRGRGSRS